MKVVVLFFLLASLAFCEDVEKKIWDYIYKGVGNKYATAGIMGNLYTESRFNPTNIQDSYEKKYGNDATYTANVDSGDYKNFENDKAGYGLAQWTHPSKKKLLLKYAQEHNKSIGDLDMQLEFLIFDMQHRHVLLWKHLKNAKSVRAASDYVVLSYERPASKNNPEARKRRADFGKKFYDKYANSDTENDAALDTVKEADINEPKVEAPVDSGNSTIIEPVEVQKPKEKKVNDIKFKTLKGAEFYYNKDAKFKPKWVVVHYTAMIGNGAKYCTKKISTAETTRKVSTHFFCDSKEVYRAVDEKHAAYHVAGGKVAVSDPKLTLEQIAERGDNSTWRLGLAAENHIRWQKENQDFEGNNYSFGVDICCIKGNKKSDDVIDQDWDFNPLAVENAAKTVAYLCTKYKIPLDHVIRHADATGKACPRPFVSLPGDDDPTKNDKRWIEFKEMVEEYL